MVKLEITDVAFGGDGVARHKGRVYFVPFTAPGDVIRAEEVQRKKKFSRAVCREVVAPSPVRTPPRCPVFGQCGGCRYQHLTYMEECRLKANQLRQLILRIGGEELSACRLTPSEQDYGYRNKVTVHGPGRPAFRGVDPAQRVEFETCPLAENTICDRLVQRVAANPLPPGRLTFRSDEQGAVYEYAEGGPVDPARRLLFDTVQDRPFYVPVNGFAQMNRTVARVIGSRLQEIWADLDGRVLIDAYAGSGYWAAWLAGYAEQIIGVEQHHASVDVAGQNLNHPHVEWIGAPLEQVVDDVLKKSASAAAVLLLDPPRSGCDKSVIKAIVERGPSVVLYMACNPALLARDIKSLTSAYRVSWMEGFDMFPRTAHFESLTVLRRRGG